MCVFCASFYNYLMESKDFINCSKCNLPIYPPKLPKGMNVKDRFDQIRCLGCNTINSYTQSQEVISYPSTKSEWKLSIWGWIVVISFTVSLISSALTSIFLSPNLVYGILISGLLIFLYKFRNLFKKN